MGMGRALPLRMAREGAAVCALDIRTDGSRTVWDELAQDGLAAISSPPISASEQGRNVLNGLIQGTGQFDALFNHAAIQRSP